MLQYACFICVTLLASIHCISCLEASVEVEVPISVKVGNSATLVCNLKPKNEKDHLSNVRWCKENEEFYRFSPDDTPQKTTSNIPGIVVVEESSDKKVVLSNLQKELTGNYTCEASWTTPSTVTAKDSKEMYVMDELKGDILLEGTSPLRSTDKLFGVCVSPASQVTPKFTWLLNGEQVSSEESQPATKNNKDPNRFIAYLKWTNGVSFVDGKANLTCVVEVDGVYNAQKTVILKSF
ncbi:uncharacterized protein LOC126890391 [Diabrotica virgifera virgifera]|uniref:Ig-like domain-containing protein n=1 Tax=Diabrotica virgifera virgifera TaxID=50390 RepID=A0ABM5KYH3_DIAVI|nr:uncharacterized protein LOC126890391 [Diabrotica virgifera virgifera]XP_050515244.1 uncharacterized protein LOC126890391 [Diabrotica virgifera virgifera]